MSGRVIAHCCYAIPAVNAIWKPVLIRYRSCSVSMSLIGVKSYLLGGGGDCNWFSLRMSFKIRESKASYCSLRFPYRPLNSLNDDFKRSMMDHCLNILLESCLNKYRNKAFIHEESLNILYQLWDANAISRRRWNITTQECKVCDVTIEIVTFVNNRSMKLTILQDQYY